MRKDIFIAHYRPLAYLSAMVRAGMVLTAFCLAATMLHTLPAFAGDGGVEIPWGDWLVDGVVWAAPVVKTALAAAVALALSFLPAPLRAITGLWWQRQADQVLGWAVSYAIAQTKNAAAGKVLTVDVTNKVVEAAMRYAIEQGPVVVKRVTGDDAERLYNMLLARLEARGMVPAGFSKDEIPLPDFS